MPVPRRADGQEKPKLTDRELGAAWSLADAWRLFAREVGVPRRWRPIDPQSRRRAVAGAFVAVLASVVLVFVPWAKAATVSSGNVTSISLDNSKESSSGGACTQLTTSTAGASSVVVTETSAGNLPAGKTLTVTLPSDFEFCGDAIAEVKSTTSSSTSLTLTEPLARLSDLKTLTVTVATASNAENKSAPAPGQVRIRSVYVKPTGTKPNSVSLAIGGTAGVSGTGDTVRSIAGAASQVVFRRQPAAGAATASATFGTQPAVVATDQFGNERRGDSFTLSIDTGPTDAKLTCNESNTATHAPSDASAVFTDCKVDKSGTYRLKVKVGMAFATSSDFTIAAVAPTGAVVKASTDVNAASYISGNSKAAVSVDVTFPTGGPRESGVVNVTLSSGGSSVTGSTSVTSAMTSVMVVTVSGINASSLPDGTVTVTASFTGGATNTGGATSATLSGTPATKDTAAPVLNSAVATSTVVLRLATDSGTFGDGVTNVTAPSFTVSNITDGSGTGIETVYVQVKPTASSTYAISGVGVTSAKDGIYTVTTATLAEGTYDVQARVVDKAGNVATFPLSPVNGVASTLTIDTTAPTATVKFAAYTDGGVMPSADASYASSLTTSVSGTQTVAVQVTFAEAGLTGTPTFTFRTANGTATSATASESSAGSGIWRAAFDVGSATSDGPVTVSMSGVTDAAENAAVFGTGQTRAFTVDNSGPTFSVGYSRASPMGGGSLTISVSSSELLPSPPTVRLTSSVASGSFAVATATMRVTTDLSLDAATAIFNWAVVDSASSSPAVQIRLPFGATATILAWKDGTPFQLQTGLEKVIGTGAQVTWIPKGNTGASLDAGSYVMRFIATSSNVDFTAPTASVASVWDGTYVVPSSGSDGTVTVAVTGTDLVGNVGNQVVAGGSFTIDTVIPTAATVRLMSDDTGVSNTDGITTAAPVFQVTAETDATADVAVWKDGVSFPLQAGLAKISGTATPTWTVTWTPKGIGGAALTNGTYVFTFTVSDGAGNAAASATTWTITLDLVRPVATMVMPTFGAYLNDATPDFVATVTDEGGVDSVSFEVKGPSPSDYTTAGSATLAVGTIASGVWQFTSTTLAEGAYEVRAFAKDKAGNERLSASSSFTIDLTKPDAPTGVGLTAATDTGASSTDGITSAVAQAITGVAEAHATVQLFDGPIERAIAISGATTTVTPATIGATTGTFTIPTTLATGTYSITAKATDRAGNESGPSSPATVVVDRTAPGAGTFALQVSDDAGASSSDGILNVATPTFTVTGPTDTGYTGAGIASVAVQTSTSNGVTWTTRGTSADTSSPYTYTVRAADLSENVQYRVQAIITDVAGNSATVDLPTSNGRIKIDLTAPVPGSLAIVENDGRANDGVIKAASATFGLTGASDLNSGIASVQLHDARAGCVATSATATGSPVTSVSGGAATLQTGTLASGTYTVCAAVTDVAGNVATTATATFTIDTTAPTPGTIALVDADGTENDGIVKSGAPTFKVTGASDTGYTLPVAARVMQVQLEVASGASQTFGFASSGIAVDTPTAEEFSAVPSTLSSGTYTVRARVTDLAGNDAWTPGLDVTVDTTAPTPGTLAIVDTDGVTNDGVVFTATPNFTITGACDTACPDTTSGVVSVQLQVAEGVTGTAFANRGTAATSATAGVFTVVSDALASGQHVARAVVTDKAGNTATTATTSFVVDLGPPTVTVQNPTANLATNTFTPTFTAHAEDVGTGVATVTFRVALASGSPNFVTVCVGGLINLGPADGNWGCVPTSSIGVDGNYLVQAVATDVAGNVATSTYVAFTVDTVRPVAPTNVGLTAATDLGVSSTDAITKVTAVTVTGTAEAGSTVRVYDTDGTTDGTTELGSVTLASGSTTFSVAVTLTEGTHQITATATDAAGNVSPPSTALPTTIDLTAPTVALTYSPPRPVKSGDTLTITATASESLGAAPIISIRGGDVGDGPMTGSGTTWTYSQTVDGGNGAANVTVTGADVAGNALTVTSGASYPVDNVAPRLATVTTSGTAYNGTASVAFTATFSEAVTGVSAANFAVSRGIGIGGVVPVVAAVTGSGTTWTVTVTTAGASGSGDGNSTVGIALDPTTMASIVDAALNQVASVAPTGNVAAYVMGPAPTPGPSSNPAPTATLAPTPTAVPTATAIPTVAVVAPLTGGSGAGGASSGGGSGGGTVSGGAVTGGPSTDDGAANGFGTVDSLIGPVAPLPAVGFPEALAASRSLAIAVASVPGGTSPEVVRAVAVALSAVPEEAARGFATGLGALPREAAGALIGVVGSVPAGSARAFVSTVGSLPAGETWQLGSIIGSIPPAQGAAFVGAVGSVASEQARAVVQVLSGSPPSAIANLSEFVAGQTAEQSTRTMASIASLAQAGTPVTIAAPYGSTTTASGREIVSFVIPVDSPPAATRRGAVEVAGAKSQGTPSRTVVILARPGQAARAVRYEAGPWPSLALVLGNGLSGALPFVNLPDTALSFTFDPSPPNLNAVQKGSLGGGIVTPLGSPFTLDVEAPDDVTIGLSFPSIAVPADASLGYLYETRDGGGNFVGYLRAPTTFVPLTGRQDWSLTAAELRATLVLPVALRPAYVANFVPGLRIWSGPYEGAKDFGPAGPLLTTYTVVAPQVGDRIYVLNEATKNFGWIDASGVAPTGPPE